MLKVRIIIYSWDLVLYCIGLSPFSLIKTHNVFAFPSGQSSTFSIYTQLKSKSKLAAGCSKHCFEVVDETDEVSNHTYGKATLTRLEEIFEEYKSNPIKNLTIH